MTGLEPPDQTDDETTATSSPSQAPPSRSTWASRPPSGQPRNWRPEPGDAHDRRRHDLPQYRRHRRRARCRTGTWPGGCRSHRPGRRRPCGTSSKPSGVSASTRAYRTPQSSAVVRIWPAVPVTATKPAGRKRTYSLSHAGVSRSGIDGHERGVHAGPVRGHRQRRSSRWSPGRRRGSGCSRRTRGSVRRGARRARRPGRPGRSAGSTEPPEARSRGMRRRRPPRSSWTPRSNPRSPRPRPARSSRAATHRPPAPGHREPRRRGPGPPTRPPWRRPARTRRPGP